MRPPPILFLVAGLTMAACEESPGPSGDGTLVVSTSTEGEDPDPDGYVLTVDGHDSFALDPTGTAEIELRAGPHTLRLTGMAGQCSVTPGTPLEVDVPPRGTAPVTFAITCPATGVRITTTTTGLDIDVNGYRIAVDGTDRGPIPVNGTAVTRLDPGSRTIVLMSLTSNCMIDGPGSRTVTIVEGEVAPIEFAVGCTARTATIGVLLPQGVEEGGYAARLDGGTPFPVGPGRTVYVAGVTPGDHVVSLVAPAHCSVENDAQSVTVTAGGLVRDTVEVTFSVTCEPTRLRISAPTTGPIPEGNYSVWTCRVSWDFDCFDDPSFVGALAPNGVLVASASPHTGHRLELRDVPPNCRVQVPNPTNYLWPAAGDTLDVEFPLACSR